MNKRKFKRLAKKSLELELEDEENFIADGMFYMVRCPKCGKENHGFYVALGRCAWCGHDEATEKQKAWRKAKLDEIKTEGGRMSESSLIEITDDKELMERVLKKSEEMQEETLKKAEEEE